jgi:UDP-N-acetylglucosamine--N-acetylmuramyl-(pentapeptide) pyrophosphoryl-undecaprenol N-acetylglucosamine transferase
MMRVLFADGGTGGHIFPAIAVADELKRRDAKTQILFTGTAAGLERELLPKHGYELKMIHVGGLIGKSIFTKLRTLMQLPYAYFESRKILSDFRPDVVIGFGAYASGPVLVAAHHKHLPILLVEPNAIPGFTNRKTLKYAKQIAVPYEDTEGLYQGKAVVTGNPVRALRKIPVAREKFTIGIFGGSQGSRAINEAVIDALPKFAEMRDRLHVIHQTGKGEFDSVSKQYEKIAPFFEVMPFIYDVETFLNRCDLLICRSGAITLAELTSLGKPAILVPLPTAAHNHQEQNARRLQEAGAAHMILQKDLSPQALLEKINAFMSSPQSLTIMSEASGRMGKPNATNNVADLALSIATEEHRE